MSRKYSESSDRGSGFLSETGRAGAAIRRKGTERKQYGICNLILIDNSLASIFIYNNNLLSLYSVSTSFIK